MQVTIRQATLSDLNASYQVEIACFPEAEAAFKTNMAHRLRLFPQGYFVAQVNNQLVGHINSGATDKDDISDEALKAMIGHVPNGKNLVIFSVAVLPDYQKRGLAGQLLRTYISWAKNSQHQTILLLCKKDLVHYYATFGFVDCGVSESTHGGAIWHMMQLDVKNRDLA